MRKESYSRAIAKKALRGVAGHTLGAGRFLLWLGALAALAAANSLPTEKPAPAPAEPVWIGTWAAAAQSAPPGHADTFHNQTIRLIVHTSAAGKKARIRISNTFGEQPLVIGAAHIARRSSGADIDPASDRALTFHGQASVTIAAGESTVSEPAELEVPALSEMAVSLFLPGVAAATTVHLLAQQTSFTSEAAGNSTGAAKFPRPKAVDDWPFLTGVDVLSSSPGAGTIVAFGSSTTDGDGSTTDANHRWPDVLAERLQKAGGPAAALGVLNEGIIGNRLLADIRSPRQTGGPFEAVLNGYGLALGHAGMTRFDRDVLQQAGVKYVFFALGVNDILFPGEFTAASESVSAESLIAGDRELIARAHKKGIRVIATTIPPFEGATFRNPEMHFFTPEKEAARQKLNEWMRSSGEFDGVVDFDAVLRDPSHPSRLLSAYDSGDHLHCNDAGYITSGNAIPLTLFENH